MYVGSCLLIAISYFIMHIHIPQTYLHIGEKNVCFEEFTFNKRQFHLSEECYYGDNQLEQAFLFPFKPILHYNDHTTIILFYIQYKLEYYDY